MGIDLEGFDYNDRDNPIVEEEGSLENENNQIEELVEQTVEKIEEQEETPKEEITETVVEPEEPKTVDIRALHEARERNRELRELLSQKDQEIGKYQHLSTQEQKANKIETAEEINPEKVLEHLSDNDPITKAEQIAYTKAVKEKELQQYQKQQVAISREKVAKDILDAKETMTDEKMGVGLSWDIVYGKLDKGEVKLTP